MSTATEFAPRDDPTRRRATSSTAVVIPMTAPHRPRARVDAGGTRLRLRALHVMGHGSARIARALGVREETIQRLVRGDTTDVSPNLRDTITDLYDAWWDKRAPERTRAERAAAARRPPPRQLAGTGAPEPPSTTTSSTSPATGPKAAGAPPPAPASRPTSTRRPGSTGRGAHDRPAA